MPETFDHATTNPGSGGTNLAGDTFSQGGVSHFLPACYLVFGPADGPYTRAEAGAGLPVAIQNATLAVTQSGSWSVSVTGTVAVSGPLTDAQLRASAVPVSGTFWQATQPVSGPLTDAQLRASEVPVDTELPAAAALADATSNPTAPAIGAFPHVWNAESSSWDREPAPQQGTVLASAARTATNTSATFTNRGHRGVILLVNVSSAGGGGSTITVHLQGYDPVSTNWLTLNSGGLAIAGTGILGAEVSPGAAGGTGGGAGTMHQRFGGGLPRTWRVHVIHSAGTSWTYSVSYQLLR